MFTCPNCKKSFTSLRGLGVHRGRNGYCLEPNNEPLNMPPPSHRPRPLQRSRSPSPSLSSASSSRRSRRSQSPSPSPYRSRSPSPAVQAYFDSGYDQWRRPESEDERSQTGRLPRDTDEINVRSTRPPHPSEGGGTCKYLGLQHALADDTNADERPTLCPLARAEFEFLGIADTWYVIPHDFV